MRVKTIRIEPVTFSGLGLKEVRPSHVYISSQLGRTPNRSPILVNGDKPSVRFLSAVIFYWEVYTRKTTKRFRNRRRVHFARTNSTYLVHRTYPSVLNRDGNNDDDKNDSLKLRRMRGQSEILRVPSPRSRHRLL